jgi:hypothetical protein
VKDFPYCLIFVPAKVQLNGCCYRLLRRERANRPLRKFDGNGRAFERQWVRNYLCVHNRNVGVEAARILSRGSERGSGSSEIGEDYVQIETGRGKRLANRPDAHELLGWKRLWHCFQGREAAIKTVLKIPGEV